MSDSQEQPWSDNPNAPKIPYELYFAEKAYFAGILICAILYGTLIVLFFQCMTALLNPANRKREGVKRGLISYTVVMFSAVTVVTGMQLNNQSVGYIDNREFPGGPYGYSLSTLSNALGIVPNSLYLLNFCLADGLLLYRCYILYSRNLWVITIPFLVYLGSVATGILMIYQCTGPLNTFHFDLSYYSVAASLNGLLTLMIVIRLVLLDRKTRAATGPPAGVYGLYKNIATITIESSALYTVNSLVVIGLYAADNAVASTFLLMLAETQVIAPLLIVQRVANKKALTGNPIVSRRISSVDEGGTNSSELGVDTTSDFHQDSKV